MSIKIESCAYSVFSIITAVHTIPEDLFLDLTLKFDEMMSSLEEVYQNDKVSELLKSLSTADQDKISEFSLFKGIKTLDDVFLYLRSQCKISDYKLLVAFVKIRQNTDAIKILNNFTEELKRSVLYELNLLSLNRAYFKDFTPDKNSRKLIIKYQSMTLSLREKEVIQSVVCKEFKLSVNSIQFVHFAEGCIRVIFRISLNVKKHLLHYPINADIIKSLFDNKIVRIIIDDEVELKVSYYFNAKVSAFCTS